MMSSKREISREGVMAHRSFRSEKQALYAARRGPGPARAKRYPQRSASTCGVTARTCLIWECRRAGGVSLRQGGTHMHNKTLTTLLLATATISLSGIAQAQTPAPAPAPAATPAAPLFATTKVEGTDNVYV